MVAQEPDTQYNIKLSAFEIGFIEGAMLVSMRVLPENRDDIMRIGSKLETQFNEQTGGTNNLFDEGKEG